MLILWLEIMDFIGVIKFRNGVSWIPIEAYLTLPLPCISSLSSKTVAGCRILLDSHLLKLEISIKTLLHARFGFHSDAQS